MELSELDVLYFDAEEQVIFDDLLPAELLQWLEGQEPAEHEMPLAA